MNSHKRCKNPKYKGFSPAMTLYICAILIFSVVLGIMAAWNTVADEAECDHERFFAESARLIADNWCDSFIESIVFTAYEPFMYVDGERVEMDLGAAVPVIIDDQMFIPVCALAEATSVLADSSIYYLNEAPVIIDDSAMLPADVIAEELVFELTWDPVAQEVTFSRDFQTRRLAVSAASFFHPWTTPLPATCENAKWYKLNR